ncbi:FMN-dependent NADH-azoreductase [Dyadobacter subterraneus]|uniref:FMN dependent NADH:quinone oxidoreductase n=1 Tax=Dyadobacter subterraneus TaxID=2773304 RepID=A0ABR9W9P8_9BACT|nr:NAD(P)H-dependent oxidoreductase [Dyadobacter subterraneus]MBE9462210.1 NAD(P)H-dependent oxidoreductase [Dyadobacter subterraneus]
MKKILNIISSPRGEMSFSNKLGNALIGKISAEYPGAEVMVRDLTHGIFPHVHAGQLEAFFTPSDQQTDLQKASVRLSDELIQEVFDADILVLNVPTYNFSIPSSVKAWLDQVVRAGITFKFDENGPKGFVTGKKAYVAISSGAVFSEGPFKENDFVEPYLKTVFGFIGITDLNFFRVEGMGIPALSETALEKALQSIEQYQLI